MFGEERIIYTRETSENKKNNTIKTLLVNAGYLLFGGIAGFLFILVMDRYDIESTLSVPVMVLTFILSIFLSFVFHIAVHELGHVILGLLTGYGFYSYRIFNWMFIREDEKWQCKKYSVPGTLGQAIMLPPKKKDKVFPWFWYNIGGGLMNLLFTIITLVIFVLLPNRSELVSVILISFMLVGAILGLSNLIPTPASMFANDGSNMLAIYKDRVAKESFYSQLTTVAHLAQNKSFKDFPLENYQLPKNANLKYMLISILTTHELEYYYDVEDFASAIALLNRLEDEPNLAKPIKLSLDSERIFLECMQGPREEAMEALCSKDVMNLMKASKNVPDMHRILMAYEGLYRRNMEEARKHYEKANELLERYPIYGIAQVEKRLLALVKAQMEEGSDELNEDVQEEDIQA